MPLGDIGAFHDWEAREHPSPRLVRAVRWWIAKLSVAPWQAPSVPIPDLSRHPDYEVRAAALDEGVEIAYRHTFATGMVDLYWVGRG